LQVRWWRWNYCGFIQATQKNLDEVDVDAVIRRIKQSELGIEYLQFSRRVGGVRRFKSCEILGITAFALDSRTTIMKWKTPPRLCVALKTVPTRLPAKTHLGQQTVCKETHGEKYKQKQPEYFCVSQHIFLRMASDPQSEPESHGCSSFITHL